MIFNKQPSRSKKYSVTEGQAYINTLTVSTIKNISTACSKLYSTNVYLESVGFIDLKSIEATKESSVKDVIKTVTSRLVEYYNKIKIYVGDLIKNLGDNGENIKAFLKNGEKIIKKVVPNGFTFTSQYNYGKITSAQTLQDSIVQYMNISFGGKKDVDAFGVGTIADTITTVQDYTIRALTDQKYANGEYKKYMTALNKSIDDVISRLKQAPDGIKMATSKRFTMSENLRDGFLDICKEYPEISKRITKETRSLLQAESNAVKVIESARTGFDAGTADLSILPLALNTITKLSSIGVNKLATSSGIYNLVCAEASDMLVYYANNNGTGEPPVNK